MFPAILIILGLALIAPFMLRFFRSATAWILALAPLGIVFYLASVYPQITGGNNLLTNFPWVPYLGVELSFFLDGLSLLFGLLIAGIGALILIYAGGYLKGHPEQGSFFSYLLLFMAAMLGVVWADNVLTLFVFWELTSISSYLLIGFDHKLKAARDGALQALLVTGLGGLALLAGLVLMGQVGGSWDLHVLLTRGELFKTHPYYLGILILILAGAFTKSAQFPFHFWLPNAMEAPTPVSAYLHSATMVQAGVYLLARLNPALGGTEIWQTLLVLFGGVTMVVGAYLALQNTDLKRILAYSTVSALGIMVFLIGSGVKEFAAAAVVFIFAHALYKGALFMMAGAVDHESGSRDVLKLGGLARKMPLTAVAGLIAALSMAGVPPLLGFLAKEHFYATAQVLNVAPQLWTTLCVVSSVFLVMVAGMVALEPFYGTLKDTPKKPHEAPLSLWLGPMLLALASLGFGLFSLWIGRTLLGSAATAVVGSPVSLKLSLWHGWDLTVTLSALTLGFGVLLYLLRSPLRSLLRPLQVLNRLGPEQWYQGSLVALRAIARGQTRFWQSGNLRYYTLMVLITALGLVGWTLFDQYSWKFPKLGGRIYPYEIMMATLVVLAALMATFSKSRLGALTGLGVVGFGIAIAFILYGAPDLAMTQILVETLVVILLVAGFHHMPGFAFLSKKRHLVFDAIIALSFGALMTMVLLAAIQVHAPPTVSEFYAKESVPLAHGHNIVNVILVDFRALDTLGEITVLALAGLGVFAMLKLLPKKEGNS